MSTDRIGFYELPSTPADRQKLEKMIEDGRAGMVRIKSEQLHVTETIAAIKEQFDISASDIRKVMTDRANGTFAKTIETSEKYQDLYASLFPKDVPKDVAADNK